MRFEWDAPYFAPFHTGLPGACWWRVPGEDGVLVHGSSWHPLMVDYAALSEHDTSTMDHWAIDGDYVHRNFGLDARVHVVQDSDECLFVSWTPVGVLDLPRKAKRALELRGIGEFLKGCLLSDAFLGPYSDPLKRRIAFLPVRMHAADLNGSWPSVEDRARDIFERYLGPNRSASRKRVMQLIGAANRICVLLAGRWGNRRHVMEMIAKALRGDRAAKEYLRRRTKLYMDQIIGR